MSACLQAADGDSLPDYPDDADIPAGGEGVSYMINAAEQIKAAGNALFKEVLQPATLFLLHAVHNPSETSVVVSLPIAIQRRAGDCHAGSMIDCRCIWSGGWVRAVLSNSASAGQLQGRPEQVFQGVAVSEPRRLPRHGGGIGGEANGGDRRSLLSALAEPVNP